MKWLMTRSTGDGNELSAAVTIGVLCPTGWIPAVCAVHARWHLLLMQWTEFLPTTNGIAGDTCYLCSEENSCRLPTELQVTPVTYSVGWIPAKYSVLYRWHHLLMQWSEFLPTTNGIAGDTCYLCSEENSCRLPTELQVTPVTYSVGWIPAKYSVLYRWHHLLMQWSEFLPTTNGIVGDIC